MSREQIINLVDPAAAELETAATWRDEHWLLRASIELQRHRKSLLLHGNHQWNLERQQNPAPNKKFRKVFETWSSAILAWTQNKHAYLSSINSFKAQDYLYKNIVWSVPQVLIAWLLVGTRSRSAPPAWTSDAMCASLTSIFAQKKLMRDKIFTGTPSVTSSSSLVVSTASADHIISGAGWSERYQTTYLRWTGGSRTATLHTQSTQSTYGPKYLAGAPIIKAAKKKSHDNY
jgi:hypothetical protein